jgi:hypothetical protein
MEVGMTDDVIKADNRRVVTAPAPSSLDEPGAVLSVKIEADEEVRWQWTHYPNGQSVVTGYEIFKKLRTEA